MKTTHIAYIFIFFCFFTASAQNSYNALVHEGNRLFDAGNYEKASSKYLGAIRREGEDFTAHYNLGNSLYKRKMYAEATAEYQKAELLSKNAKDKSVALYNQGNAMMQSENFEKAAELYKKALKSDPYNETIRENYQIAKLKNIQNKSSNNSQKEQNTPAKKNDEADKNNDDNLGKQQSGGENDNNSGKGEGENSKNHNKNNDDKTMPENLKQAILNRMEEREQETARRILNKNSYYIPKSNDKDW